MIDLIKEYTTRNGCKVAIRRTDGGTTFPVMGEVYLPEEKRWVHMRWRLTGISFESSCFDLVEKPPTFRVLIFKTKMGEYTTQPTWVGNINKHVGYYDIPLNELKKGGSDE